MRRIGITGGIGSGKSTVAKLLQNGPTAHKGGIIDADALSKRCTEPQGAAMPAILAAFGPDYLTPTGALNRDAMRQLVFQDATAKARLEAIVHPCVAQAIADAIDGLPGDQSWVLLDIPLLVESTRWRPQLDAVWVVDCSEATQIDRVMRRNQWSAEQVQAVMRNQASRAERLQAADVVVYNETNNLDQLQQQLLALMPWTQG